MPTEIFKRAAASDFELTPEAMAILQERWSDISPEEGTEECVCSWCGKMIGRAEAHPVWKDHIEYCVGCEICEIAVRYPETSSFASTPSASTKSLRLRTKHDYSIFGEDKGFVFGIPP